MISQTLDIQFLFSEDVYQLLLSLCFASVCFCFCGHQIWMFAPFGLDFLFSALVFEFPLFLACLLDPFFLPYHRQGNHPCLPAGLILLCMSFLICVLI